MGFPERQCMKGSLQNTVQERISVSKNKLKWDHNRFPCCTTLFHSEKITLSRLQSGCKNFSTTGINRENVHYIWHAWVWMIGNLSYDPFWSWSAYKLNFISFVGIHTFSNRSNTRRGYNETVKIVTRHLFGYLHCCMHGCTSLLWLMAPKWDTDIKGRVH